MQQAKSSRKGLFVFIVFLFWFANYVFVPTFSVYCQGAGATLAVVGVIASAYGLSQLIARVPLGILSDALGRRKIFIMTLGFISLIIAPACMALFPHTASLFFMRLLTGLSASAWVCFTVLFSSYFKPEDGPKAIAIMNTTSVAGQLVANFSGGIIADKAGAAAPFWVATAAAVIGLGLSFLIVEKRAAVHVKPDPKGLIAVGKNKSLVTVSLLAALSQFIAFGAAITFTPLLAKELGASDTQLGILSTCLSLAGVPASYLAGSYLMKRLGYKNVIVACLGVTTLLCIAYPFAKDIMVLYLIQLIFGFVRMLMFTIQMGMSIQSTDPAKRGSAMGFFQAVYSLGIFFGPLVMGYICDGFGLLVSFLFTAVLALAGVIASLFFLEGKKKERPARQA